MLALLFALLFHLANASNQIYLVQFNSGRYTVNFVFNGALLNSSSVAFVGASGNQLYFQTVYAYSNTSNIECRQSTEQRIITGPVGCSDLLDPGSAIITTNCIPNDIQVKLRQQIFYSTWYLSQYSSECYAAGGNGDPRLCTGPLYISLDNENSFIPGRQYTVTDLLASRMTFLAYTTGPLAMSPAVVEVQMVLPAILVSYL